MTSYAGEVTRLLSAWAQGNDSALDELMPLVYDELRRIAQAHARKRQAGQTLQPTAIINEAFVKLIDQRDKPFQNRSHFFAVASTAMRHVLANYARASRTQKRGSRRPGPLADRDLAIERDTHDILAVNDALDRLQRIDARKSRVVELRYFGGLSIEEVAEALDISTMTVTRDWSVARAWLAREIGMDRIAQP